MKLLCSTPERSTTPLLIYLPGMDGMGTLFHLQIPHLADVFTIRCLAIAPELDWGWQDLAASLATLIEAEQRHTPHRPVYLCGESFGGCLALQLAMQFPKLVDHLILVNPASSLGRRPWLHGSGGLARSLPSGLYSLSCVALVQLLVNRGRVAEPVYHTLLQTVRSLPQTTVARRLEQLCQFAPAPAALRRIGQPTLIIASGADRLLPSVAEAAYLQQHLPQVRSHRLPHSGHACLLEPEVQLNVILAQQGWCLPGSAAPMLAPTERLTPRSASPGADRVTPVSHRTTAVRP